MSPHNIFPILLIFVVILVSGCTQVPPESPEPSSVEPVSYENNVYSLERPAEWELEEHESFVYFKTPLESDSNNLQESDSDNLQENVVIYVYPLEDKEQDLVHLIQESLEILIATTHGFAVVDHGEASFGDIPAYKMIYTEGEEGSQIKYLQVFAVDNGNSYILTYTSPVETFDKYLPEAEAIISSYRIK